MDQLRESSLLFSLKGLLETERERVQREAREARARSERELQRAHEAAERRRVASEQERAAQERRLALVREREKLEDERIEALKHATIERARIETESRVRLIELEQQRAHDITLAAFEHDAQAARSRTNSRLACGACLALLLAASLSYFFHLAPQHARARSSIEKLLATERERTSLTERALAAEQSQNQTLRHQLATQQAMLVNRPAAGAGAPEVAAATQNRVSRSADEPPPKRAGDSKRAGDLKLAAARGRRPCRDDGDPLNPSLLPCQ